VMQDRRLFITGINGLIGRVLQSGLYELYDIWGLDCAGQFSERVAQANIRDYEQVIRAFRQASPFRYLVHLAANPSVDAKWELILQDNIQGTRNIFEAARELGVNRVVFASSNHVTGAYEGFSSDLYSNKQYEPFPISIADPVRPDSYYGVSKAFGEALARYYSARWGIEFICLRIGTVLHDDDPTQQPRHMKTWLSHRDLVQLVNKSLVSNVMFGIYYGVSANKGVFWDISNARSELGYEPVDDASEYRVRGASE